MGERYQLAFVSYFVRKASWIKGQPIIQKRFRPRWQEVCSTGELWSQRVNPQIPNESQYMSYMDATARTTRLFRGSV
jgi:hypothetical protein